MALFDGGRGGILAIALGALAAGCVPTLDEERRGCPCAAGHVCCASANVCVRDASACERAPAGGGPPDATTAPAPDSSALPPPPNDAAPDAPHEDAQAADAAPPDGSAACATRPEPVVHFTFEDCDDGGIYRDTAGGLVGVRRGAGVHCARGPLGAALRFDGDADGGGSYVRVLDGLDAGERACTGSCRPVPEQFANALSVSVVLNVAAGQPFAHILGQWYDRDSYMLLTESSDAGQRMELSVQQGAGDAAATTLEVLFPVETWIHWVAVFDGAELRLYRDGALAMYQPLAQAGALQCSDVPLELGQIGREGPCGGDINYAFFKGQMGDLQLFDVALTPTEVAGLACSLRGP